MFHQLPEILHNTEDHLDVLNDILVGNGALSEAKTFLLRHIVLEEKANLDVLNTLLQSSPSYEVEAARDHSQLILDIVSGQFTPELGAKLIEHLLEEQKELSKRILAKQGKAATSPARSLTVGSLIGK